VEALAWVRDPFPASWDRVRRALAGEEEAGVPEQEAPPAKSGLIETVRKFFAPPPPPPPVKPPPPKRPHIPYAEYRRLCTEKGVAGDGMQDSLAEILHHLGAALNYRKDPRLREATVLQPEWLTNNVYKLMRHAEAQGGLLKQADLPRVLSDEPDPEMRAYLVRLMERFEIAYPQRPQNTELWLVPQALPDNQPAEAAAFASVPDATRLRYAYAALPEGLVARAIVRLHEFIEETPDGKKQQWASGAILTREGARALLRKEPEDRVVMITVTGADRKARQQLAGLCQAEMRDIHREIPGLDPLEETQVQGEWVRTSTLESDERKGRPSGLQTRDGTVTIDPAEANNAYTEKPARQEEVWKPSVFISYSKSNVNQRKRLELELKVLKNAGLLAGHWQDRMIDPGDPWDQAIQIELGKAEVVLVLCSTPALATDYITQYEIPKALEQEAAGRTLVVPLILEACGWHLSNFSKNAALPEKGQPINEWTPRSRGWKSVATGLEKLCRKLIEKGPRGMTNDELAGLRHSSFVILFPSPAGSICTSASTIAGLDARMASLTRCAISWPWRTVRSPSTSMWMSTKRSSPILRTLHLSTRWTSGTPPATSRIAATRCSGGATSIASSSAGMRSFQPL
jgi:hypothetical protein